MVILSTPVETTFLPGNVSSGDGMRETIQHRRGQQFRNANVSDNTTRSCAGSNQSCKFE
jgi:hypothetical protein